MKVKVFVVVLLGLMLLGVTNAAFSEEQQPKPQARERFVLKDIQPAGDESNGRVPLMGDDSESDHKPKALVSEANQQPPCPPFLRGTKSLVNEVNMKTRRRNGGWLMSPPSLCAA